MLNDDGSISFPKLGDPPKSVEGYDVDPNNPYVFWPVWEPCEYRYQRKFLCQNGRVRQRPACTLHAKDVTFPICDACKDCK